MDEDTDARDADPDPLQVDDEAASAGQSKDDMTAGHSCMEVDDRAEPMTGVQRIHFLKLMRDGLSLTVSAFARV